MTGGYSTVPEELYQTAGKISDAVGTATGLKWQGPSGDYGHAGVQAGWSQFIDELGKHVKELHEKADHHSEGLKRAASSYTDSEDDAAQGLSKLGDLFDDSPGVPGGGFTGGITGILGGVGGLGEPVPTDAGADLGGLAYEPRIGSGLHDVPGGGFTGNLTPTELDERLGEGASGTSGVMSPERSRELFPDSAGGEEPHSAPGNGEGPVY